MTYRARLAARRDRRILASLPPVPVPADEDRDPLFCFTCGRRCGSQPHK